ncbi:protein-L-isoaspartate O-methyltransferase-like protein [Carex littledalei]|uniref:Protein-L-isoaspartate O-methyltransferase n=1 Tax=Carex littledalei TaxID=544730 RepID=A0A833VYZ9_9POAL|nr:protein-L-isoaspartate O-methyltransferase-like protein [Carex littledalei]
MCSLRFSLPLSVPRISLLQSRRYSSCDFSRFFPSCYPGEKLQRGCRRFQSFLKMEVLLRSLRPRLFFRVIWFLGFILFLQFWIAGSIDKNKALVEHLQQHGKLRSDKVAEVMETIDRALFVQKEYPPYVDSPMPIGYNATISAPHMHALCLELLKDHIQPGMHALDVGSGSGYLTACFAMMVGPEGRAVGIEHIPELVAASIENVKRSAAAHLLEKGSLSLHVADGRDGWPEAAPYDAIHVGAAAPEIPKALLDQLKPGGRMVIPVGHFFQDLQVIDKKLDGSITFRNVTGVRYVPLTSRSAQLQNY